MPAWRQRGDLWTVGPAEPKGVVQFLGGSGLGASPQLSYKRLLEAISRRGWLVQCWSYLPSFDHQLLAVQAWQSFRAQRHSGLPVLRLGHSMGCKLHLLAPDQGRGCRGEALLSFNNFSADRSIPLLGELAPRLGVRSEFSPGPEETLRLIGSQEHRRQRLLIRFRQDQLDQSRPLLRQLQAMGEQVELLELSGDHLTPASAGLRQQWLGGLGDEQRQRQLDQLAHSIERWWQQGPGLTPSGCVAS